MTGGPPAPRRSRPSLRRWRFASSRVDPPDHLDLVARILGPGAGRPDVHDGCSAGHRARSDPRRLPEPRRRLRRRLRVPPARSLVAVCVHAVHASSASASLLPAAAGSVPPASAWLPVAAPAAWPASCSGSVSVVRAREREPRQRSRRPAAGAVRVGTSSCSAARHPAARPLFDGRSALTRRSDRRCCRCRRVAGKSPRGWLLNSCAAGIVSGSACAGWPVRAAASSGWSSRNPGQGPESARTARRTASSRRRPGWHRSCRRRSCWHRSCGAPAACWHRSCWHYAGTALAGTALAGTTYSTALAGTGRFRLCCAAAAALTTVPGGSGLRRRPGRAARRGPTGEPKRPGAAPAVPAPDQRWAPRHHRRTPWVGHPGPLARQHPATPPPAWPRYPPRAWLPPAVSSGFAAPPRRRVYRLWLASGSSQARQCCARCRAARSRASGQSPVKLPGAGTRSGSPAPRRSWSHAPPWLASACAAAPPGRVDSCSGPPGVPRTCGCAATPGSCGQAGSVSPLAAAPVLTASALSAPCASRVTSGGDVGARAARLLSAARMSSGRTAGMTCRTTIRSLAFPMSPPPAAPGSVSMVITAARASTRRGPLLVSRSTSSVPHARKPATAPAASAGGTPGRTTCHCDASSGRAPSVAGSSVTSITSIPSGRAASSRSATSDTAQALVTESSRSSASLAAVVKSRASVRDLRVRREVRRNKRWAALPGELPAQRHARYPCGWQKRILPLHGVPDNRSAGSLLPRPPRRRACRRRPGPSPARCRRPRARSRSGPARDHRQREQRQPGRPGLDLGAHGRADAAVVAGCPAAVVDLLRPGGVHRVLPVLPELSRGPARRRGGPRAAPRCSPAPGSCTSPGRRAHRPVRRARCPPTGRRRSARSTRRTAATAPRRPDHRGGAPVAPRDSSPSMADGLPSW